MLLKFKSLSILHRLLQINNRRCCNSGRIPQQKPDTDAFWRSIFVFLFLHTMKHLAPSGRLRTGMFHLMVGERM